MMGAGGEGRERMEARFRSIAKRMQESLLETLWPTRCCVCDAPGLLLCEVCRERLEFVDYWRACPSCGGPLGFVQCTECNAHALRRMEGARYPFDSCVNSVLLNDAARKIVLACKDGGERRLAAVMADVMVECLPASWRSNGRSCPRTREADALRGKVPAKHEGGRRLSPDPRETGLPEAVFYVPASKRAFEKRGFDHAELLAKEVAARLGLPCWTPLARPSAKDQRALGRADRARNAIGSFGIVWHRDGFALSLSDGRLRAIPASVVLVDDVFTSGSTLSGATLALKQAGAHRVHAATFARTWS